MRADENVCQTKVLILHEHEETGEAISTEQIWKRTVCCVPRYRRLSEAGGGGARKTGERDSHRIRSAGKGCQGHFDFVICGN